MGSFIFKKEHICRVYFREKNNVIHIIRSMYTKVFRAFLHSATISIASKKKSYLRIAVLSYIIYYIQTSMTKRKNTAIL